MAMIRLRTPSLLAAGSLVLLNILYVMKKSDEKTAKKNRLARFAKSPSTDARSSDRTHSSSMTDFKTAHYEDVGEDNKGWRSESDSIGMNAMQNNWEISLASDLPWAYDDEESESWLEGCLLADGKGKTKLLREAFLANIHMLSTNQWRRRFRIERSVNCKLF